MDARHTVAEIGLLLYPGAQMAAVHGLTDLFTVANRIAAQKHGARLPQLRISHWQAQDNAAPQRIFDSLPQPAGHPAAVLIPPSLFDLPPAATLYPLTHWLHTQHSEGAAIASVCLGVFLLAETGLLDGRTVTTHWNHAQVLAERYPRLNVAADQPMIDDGDILTSAGLMAWAELGLRLVERLLGPSIASETARFLVIEHNQQRECAGNFAPILNHGDEAILKVQHWLQASGAVDVNLAAMAHQATLEERTFLRRFRAATGLTPTRYCQHLRVGKARTLLEFTQRSVDQIAWSVGYQDPGSFRSTFRKITGLSPSDYRGRFGAPTSAQPALA